jgi:hypothetical protein
VLAAAGEKAPQADAVYRFENNSTTLKLSGGAYVKDGLLHFDSPGAAELPDSIKYSITPAGLTMTALVRFHAKPAGHDLGEDIFSKGREWLFSRHGKGMLYLSHSSDASKGKKFYGGVRAGRIVPAGEWAHYTAVFQRIQRQGQGETGYLQKVYINGEQVGQAQVLDIEPLRGKDGCSFSGAVKWERVGYVPRVSGAGPHPDAAAPEERWLPDPLLPDSPFPISPFSRRSSSTPAAKERMSFEDWESVRNRLLKRTFRTEASGA